MMAYKPPPELRNRIESIKKKFEVVAPCNVNADNFQVDNVKKTQSQCRNATPKKVSSILTPEVEVSPESASNEKSKDKLKTTSSYSGKGNIRRTPAFRCDKSVLSHQSSNVDKKSRSVVDTRVKLFEDRQNCSESTSAEKIVEKRFMPVKQVKSVSAAKPLTKIKPKNTPTPNPKIKQIRGVSVGADIIVNGNSSVCGVNNLKDPKFKCFSPTPERTPVKERYANDLKDSSPLVVNVVRNKSNLLVNERFAQENERLLKSRAFGCEILRECDNSQKPPVLEPQSGVEDTLTNSLRAALKAPPPPGPPPKKPLFCWKLGIITKLFKGRDERVRTVEVKTPHASYVRHINRLCPLPSGK